MSDFDPVSKPEHYNSHPSGIECIQVTEHMGFCLGNAIKYIWRANLNSKKKQDLEKAIWYIKRELSKCACSGTDGGLCECADKEKADADPLSWDNVKTAHDEMLPVRCSCDRATIRPGGPYVWRGAEGMRCMQCRADNIHEKTFGPSL